MSFSDHAVSKAELRAIITPALNEDSMDAEHDALMEIADLVGIEYDDDAEKYFLPK